MEGGLAPQGMAVLGGERDTAVRASIASNGYLFGEAGASPMKSE
jgi:hypothetical protein